MKLWAPRGQWVPRDGGRLWLPPIAGAADWPLYGDAQEAVSSFDGGSGYGTQLTASATPNTKGSVSEIIASTSVEAAGLIVYLSSIGNGSRILFDILIGASGSEKVLVENIHFSGGRSAIAGTCLYFPISVPEGSRLSGRSQSSVVSDTCRVNLALLSASFAPSSPLNSVLTYGAVTSDSGGTSIDPGGTANTKGSWVELSASVTDDILALAMSLGNDANAIAATCNWSFDIGQQDFLRAGSANTDVERPVTGGRNGVGVIP